LCRSPAPCFGVLQTATHISSVVGTINPKGSQTNISSDGGANQSSLKSTERLEDIQRKKRSK